MNNQTKRVLALLEMFSKGEIVIIENLMNHPLWYGLSEKTIRRDLDIIKSNLSQSFECVRTTKGAYKAVTNSLLENFVDNKMLSLLVIAYNIAKKNSLFSSLDLSKDDKYILENKIKESSKCYEFINKAIENGKLNLDMLKSIEFAIKHAHKITLKYNANSEKIVVYTNPYKIIFINENFYLVTFADDIFSVFRLLNIEEIAVSKDTFHKNYEVLDFIKTMQTPFAKFSPNFKENLIDVKIVVFAQKARYFKAKKFFNSQVIEKENDDGSVIVSYKFTQTLEVKSFLLSWIEDIKILEPASLKDEMKENLLNSLANFK
ncbi:WYL domain-containing transcriptional regulator [Campylobacter geochelonis]|uniref:WYL domain-containing transcriptional regulator n=1 Tax=Campylobacter geochelonis TaxID=1780362 RepID=UPI000770AF37|nr:WYL domain-containing transcriptional regulator [Campylobacter geochelonis]CZE50709.1 aspartate ammonia-lyase [Campylobacter geochelonis]